MTLLAVVMLGGCANMTPTEKTITTVVVGALVVGAIISLNKNDSAPGSACRDTFSVGSTNTSGVSFASCP